jgi:hypothetical protein
MQIREDRSVVVQSTKEEIVMTMFEFDMEAQVKLVVSGEKGVVIGRAQYAFGNENLFLVRYVAADGRQVEGWLAGSALSKD